MKELGRRTPGGEGEEVEREGMTGMGLWMRMGLILSMLFEAAWVWEFVWEFTESWDCWRESWASRVATFAFSCSISEERGERITAVVPAVGVAGVGCEGLGVGSVVGSCFACAFFTVTVPFLRAGFIIIMIGGVFNRLM